MVSRELIDKVRIVNKRYASHLESGNHVLRPGSQQEIAHAFVDYSREIDPETKQVHTNGYIVAPGGLGKTISGGDIIVGINTMPNGRNVLGDTALGIRVLVTAPSNLLVDQWADALLGEKNEETGIREPSVFGDRFSLENVGIYHADLSDEEKAIVLSKAVVIIVHDSLMISYNYVDPRTGRHAPRIRPKDFGLVLIDEVDDKVRGDVTSMFYKEVFFPHCLVIGLTATHLFRSGKTIGYYLYGGKKPICEITHLEAVKRREIAPHINIIVEREIDPASVIQSEAPLWDEYSEAEQLRIIEQTGSDIALLEVIKAGKHPVTGKPLREMMQLHQAVNIAHAIYLADQLNQAFGSRYAEAVWGDTDEMMDDEMRRIIKWFLKTGEIKAVVQCKLWGRGTNIPPLEMTVQHSPMLSPNKLVQFHTRASRKDDGKKTAIYLSPFINGIDQLIVGQVLGGLYMIPDGYEYPPTADQTNAPPETEPWAVIKGVKVHYTKRQLEMFAEDLHRQRYVNGLPVKARHLLALEEMAKALGIDPNILRERVYAPLQEAYEKKQAREKTVTIESGHQGEVLHVRGKMFPAWRVGFYQHKSKEVFCVEQDLMPLCEHTLYGRLDRAPLEMLDRGNLKRLIGCSDTQIDKFIQKLQHAFFQRRPYERSTEIDGLPLSYDTFAFYRNRNGVSEFFLSPDALIPAYRLVHGTGQEQAAKWAEQPSIRQCKTSSWLTEADVIEALELSPILRVRETAFIKSLFDSIKPQLHSTRPGQEREVAIGKGKHRSLIKCAVRWLPLAAPDRQIATCVDYSFLGWINRELGMESTADGGEKIYQQSPDGRSQPAPSL